MPKSHHRHNGEIIFTHAKQIAKAPLSPVALLCLVPHRNQYWDCKRGKHVSATWLDFISLYFYRHAPCNRSALVAGNAARHANLEMVAQPREANPAMFRQLHQIQNTYCPQILLFAMQSCRLITKHLCRVSSN